MAGDKEEVEDEPAPATKSRSKTTAKSPRVGKEVRKIGEKNGTFNKFFPCFSGRSSSSSGHRLGCADCWRQEKEEKEEG